MIITSRKEVFYKIEMTAQQAHDIQILLETGRGGHVNELSIGDLHDSHIATEVHETIKALRETLEGR